VRTSILENRDGCGGTRNGEDIDIIEQDGCISKRNSKDIKIVGRDGCTGTMNREDINTATQRLVYWHCH